MKRAIIAYARSLGFERVGVTSAETFDEASGHLASWLAQGRAGEMRYMEKDPGRRARPADLLPGAKSVIALAMSYYIPEPRDFGRDARVSRYARGKDYHKVIGKRLEALTRYIEALAPDVRWKMFVDTGPLLERAVAQRAGLGFIGKNTMLITKGLGSWVFLASVATTLDLPPDPPDDRSCGDCRLCIDACPTDALTAPYELDARRCIAYLTIESKGSVAPELRERTGGWIFGCDICQEVCPHNTRVPSTPVGELKPARAASVPRLTDILSLAGEREFQERFAGTAFLRAGRHGLIRNACLAAANLQRTDVIPLLEERSRDPHPVIKEHAAWALRQLRRTNAAASNPADDAQDRGAAIHRSDAAAGA